MIGSPYLTSRSLGDEASGIGSPTTTIREDVDLAEVNEPVVAQSDVDGGLIGGASIKAGVLRAGRPTNNVGSGHTGTVSRMTTSLVHSNTVVV